MSEYLVKLWNFQNRFYSKDLTYKLHTYVREKQQMENLIHVNEKMRSTRQMIFQGRIFEVSLCLEFTERLEFTLFLKLKKGKRLS